MRKCYETHNFASMLALIEEVQTMGNRMEAALSEQDNYKDYHERASKEYKKYKKVRKAVEELEKKKEELSGKKEEEEEEKKGWRKSHNVDDFLDDL